MDDEACHTYDLNSRKMATTNKLLFSGKSQPVTPSLFNKDLLLRTGSYLETDKEWKKKITENTLLSCGKSCLVEPTLYNKSLLIEKQMSPAKPNLFSTQLLISSQLESSFSHIKIQETVIANKRKSKNIDKLFLVKRQKENISRKRKKESGRVIKEKVSKSDFHEPVYELNFDDDLRDPELLEIQKRLRSAKENIFVENKDESDIRKLQKEKIDAEKISLINMVSIALMNAPNINDVNDGTRQDLMKKVKVVAENDPEFVLKVALYTRRVLNVRTVSTFILAFAAYLPETRPYLKKYFKQSIVLPSDWISVGEFYQTFLDGNIKVGAFGAALRKVMVERFQDFDEYQLGKYNKDKGKTKTKTIQLYPTTVEFLQEENFGAVRGISVDEDQSTTMEYELKSLSLKQLIRKLHISEPSYHVMCLVGKKYPSTLEEFYRSRLPGIFEEEKAGKRMKLKTAETWETQVSLKGNKASTWQDLIDHKRLPFMAMLRNLRNMIQAGLENKYHNKIIYRLTDENTVINSKQFPFRFLSAYDIIEMLEDDLNKGVVYDPTPPPMKKGKAKKSGAPKSINYDQALLNRYKKALETALKISVIHNISPIAGTTMIIIDVDPYNSELLLTKSISSVKRTILDMSLLLGMMCKFHCEDCQLVLSLSKESGDKYLTIGDLDGKNILDNVHKAKEMVKKLWEGSIGLDDFHSTILYPSLCRKRKFDNFLIVGAFIAPFYLQNFMALYRKEVNPECLAVRISLLSKSVNDTKIDGGYDVQVNGYSDQVLRYISERGNGRQLTTVENVDIAFSLSDVKVKTASKMRPAVPTTVMKVDRPLLPWRTVRVFISSTFHDMHGERDLLTRYVFPELRCWCYNYCLNIYEVDLRWGITQKQSQSSKQLEICLREVMRCDLFIGILGERFGWVPDNYNVSDQTGLEWLKEMPSGCSMTELEMRGFLQRDKSSAGKALFFLRDPGFLKNVPKKLANYIQSNDAEHIRRLECLKRDVSCTVDAFVYKNYPCQWGGVLDGKPYTSRLEQFGHAVLKNLWVTIKRNLINAKNVCEEMEVNVLGDKHIQFAKEVSKKFVGRETLLQKAQQFLNVGGNFKDERNLLVIAGQNGSGKTAYMAELVKRYQASTVSREDVCCYFPEAGVEYQNLTVMLKFIFSKLNNTFNLGFSVPETYGEIKVQIENVLKGVAKKLFHDQCCIFIDGIDQINTTNHLNVIEWIPSKLPKGILLVISCVDNGPCYRWLSSHKQTVSTIKVGALEHTDRVNLVRKILAQHGKQLDESAFNNQMVLLLSKRGAESPLYLKLACEELRMFGVYEKLNDFLRKLAQTTPQLTEFILQRIEMEYGKDLMKNVFSVLYFTRHGLTENDLYESLNLLHNLQSSSLVDTAKDYGSTCYFNKQLIRKQIPHSYFLRMCREVKIFLHENEENGLINLVHKDITDIIERSYIKPSGDEYASIIHVVLASFLRKQADPNNDLKWQGGDMNALTELPFHMAASDVLWDDLYIVLTSPYFIKSKIEGGMCMQLLEDLHLNFPITQRTWLNSKKKFLQRDGIKDIMEFVSNKIHLLTRFPKMFVQMAVNAPDKSFMQRISECIPSDDVSSVIKWKNKPVEFSNCLLTISSIQSAVMCVSLSKDDNLVACGTSSGAVYVYDKHTGKELNAFYGHAGAVTACCYAGQDRLCSASADGTVAVWNVKEAIRMFVLKKHKEAVTCCVATTTGNNMVISVSLDNTAVLWTLSDGKEAGELTGFEHPFNCVALDPEEKHAALGGWKRDIIIWNILENQQMKPLRGHNSSVRSLAYSPNGRYLVSASLDGEILLWSTQNRTKVGQLSCHSSPVQHLEFTSNGLHLVGACTDTSVKVWSGSLGCSDFMYKRYSSETDDVRTTNEYALCVCACDKYLAVGYNSGNVCVFNKLNGNKLCHSWKAHSSSIRSMCFIKHSSSQFDLLTAADDQQAKRWNLLGSDGLSPSCIYILCGHTDGVTCVRAKEATIITSCKDSIVRLYQGLYIEDEELNKAKTELSATECLYGHTGIVTCCDISPCETKAISSGFDKALYVWDLNEATPLCVVYNAHQDGVTACCWSDVGSYVITASNDFMLKLWNTNVIIQNRKKQEMLKPRVSFTGHTSTINDVKYKFGCVSSASADGTLKIWTHNGVEITSFSPNKERLNGCDIWAPVELDEQSDLWSSFDPNTKTIQQKVRAMKPKSLHDVIVYTASDDGNVVGWRPFMPNLLHELYEHSNEVTQVVCSSTSNEILSCGLDESIKLWNTSAFSDDEKTTHLGSVTCLAVHQNSLLATGGVDGYVHIYQENIWKTSLNISLADGVRAVKFLSPSRLLTCSGDGLLSVWNIWNGKILASHKFKSPVLCIGVKKEVQDTFIVAFICSNVIVFKWKDNNLEICCSKLIPRAECASPEVIWYYPHTGKKTTETDYRKALSGQAAVNDAALIDDEPTLFFVPIGLVDMCFVDDTDDFFASSVHGKCQLFNLKKLTRNMDDEVVKLLRGEPQSTIHCTRVTTDDHFIYIFNGHSDGKLSVEVMCKTDADGERTDVKWFSSKQVHSGTVTGVLAFDEVIITGSVDSTIKVWKRRETDLQEMMQVGLFCCRSSVISLEGTRTNDGIALYVGDRIGNVEFLTLKMQ